MPEFPQKTLNEINRCLAEWEHWPGSDPRGRMARSDHIALLVEIFAAKVSDWALKLRLDRKD